MASDNQKKDFWFAVLWPLRPLGFVQNEAASHTITGDTDKQNRTIFTRTKYTSLPIPKNYFQNNSNFQAYRRFVLLSPPFTFENGNYESCDFLRSITVSSFQTARRELKSRLDEIPGKCHQPVKTCGECIESLYPLIPQRLDVTGLFVSEFLTSLKSNKKTPQGFKCSENNNICTKYVTISRWEKNQMLWVAGESRFQADQIWWGKFGLEILKEGGFTVPTAKDTTVVLGPISFFYDNIPDLINFFLTKHLYPESARHLLGLTYAMKEARKAWLFDWVGRLAETIMKMEDLNNFAFLAKYQHLKERYEYFTRQFSKSPETATKSLRVAYARDALEWMARVLAFFETSPENAISDQTTFLDYNNDDNLIAISQFLKKIDPNQNNISIWQPFLSKQDTWGDNFQRSSARLLFIREFLEESAETINSALDAKGVVKIKGSKAAKLKADLVRHARLNPLTGKILLLGEPGGGKGLTAKQYHKLALDEIRKNKFLLKNTIKEIWDRLINLLMLPMAQEVVDGDGEENDTEFKAKKLLSFVKAQLQGTTWWQWGVPRDSDKDGNPPTWLCGKTSSCPKIARNEDQNNALKVNEEFCTKCPLKPYLDDLIRSIPPNVASNAVIDTSVQFMTHYLARLLYAVYGINDNPKPKTDENFVQILCGVLAEQGPEFISSMRRLFGTAQDVDMPIPGLFQTVSYMGGTLFLDEIADAPVKIQDNLLGPLEEKKVSRLGWESIEEDVGNIRIVAATHKDIRALVRRYDDTKDSPKPQGFRPDLLSRLIIFPPVYPSSVTEYFLYENDQEQKMFRMDFISIMLEILDSKEKAKDVKYPDGDRKRRFLENLFDTIDNYFLKTMRMMDFPTSQFSAIKKSLVSNITMRLFVGILEEVALAEKQAEYFAKAQDPEQEQNAKQMPSDKDSKPDLNEIARKMFKLQEGTVKMSSIEKQLEEFYAQTERLVTNNINLHKVPPDKREDFKRDMLNCYDETLKIMITREKLDLPQASKSFLDARLSDIRAINLPKLLNYIINPDV